jgi:hypothetical protein
VTMTIHVTVEIDIEPIVQAASLVLGRAALPNEGDLQVRIFDEIRKSIKADIPHVISVTETDFKDC